MTTGKIFVVSYLTMSMGRREHQEQAFEEKRGKSLQNDCHSKSHCARLPS